MIWPTPHIIAGKLQSGQYRIPNLANSAYAEMACVELAIYGIHQTPDI